MAVCVGILSLDRPYIYITWTTVEPTCKERTALNLMNIIRMRKGISKNCLRIQVHRYALMSELQFQWDYYTPFMTSLCVVLLGNCLEIRNAIGKSAEAVCETKVLHDEQTNQ